VHAGGDDRSPLAGLSGFVIVWSFSLAFAGPCFLLMLGSTAVALLLYTFMVIG